MPTKKPHDEIVQHIHQKHPERDCSTYSCWTCGIRFRKENAMKHNTKTVKHQLEAKKYTITEETITNSELQVILVDSEADLLKVQTDPTRLLIQNVNIPQITLIEAPNVQNNELIPSSKDVPNNLTNSASNDALNLTSPEAVNTSTMSELDEQISKENLDLDQHDNAKKNAEIETVVEGLLEALNEDEAPNTEQKKEKIITQYHHDDDIVELEINEWLPEDSWGNTPAIEEMIPVSFKDM